MMSTDGVSAVVKQHFSRPCGAGRLEGDCLHGRGGALKNGTLIELWLRLDGAVIAEAGFEAFGCPSAIAAGSWLCQWLPGKTVEEALSLDGLAIAEALQLAAAKRAVALTAEDALKAALARRRAPDSNK